MSPSQISILGVGLLGGSLGLALRGVAPKCRIVGHGHRPETLQKAKEIGAIDEGIADAAESVRGSDMVVLCTPVGLFESMLQSIAPALSRGCIVTDVGSTKRSIVGLAEKFIPRGVHFVASHPMAGSEKRGVEFAKADLFQKRLCIVTPTARSHKPSVKQVEEFWQMIGMNTTRLSPEEHDRRIAEVSHLPHLVAAVMVSLAEWKSLDLCGQGFLDATRIAAGDGGLWRDIFVDNADNLRQGVKELRDKLDSVLALTEHGDGEELRRWLDDAAKKRAELAQKKLREMNAE